jgi:hypothetical protein
VPRSVDHDNFSQLQRGGGLAQQPTSSVYSSRSTISRRLKVSSAGESAAAPSSSTLPVMSNHTLVCTALASIPAHRGLLQCDLVSVLRLQRFCRGILPIECLQVGRKIVRDMRNANPRANCTSLVDDIDQQSLLSLLRLSVRCL